MSTESSTNDVPFSIIRETSTSLPATTGYSRPKKQANKLSQDWVGSTAQSQGDKKAWWPSFVLPSSQGWLSPRKNRVRHSLTTSDGLERNWEVEQIKPNNTKNKRILTIIVPFIGPNSDKKAKIRIKKLDA